MKKALCEASGRIAQIETEPFPVSPFLTWRDCADDVTLAYIWNGSAFALPQAVPVPTPDQLEAACLGALNGGGAVDTARLIKAKVVSDLAWRLGKAPGALTAAEVNAERNRIAAIYKNL